MSHSGLDEHTSLLLQNAYPHVSQSEFDAAKMSTTLFSDVQYTLSEKTEIEQWTLTASNIGSSSEDEAKTADRLASLNTHLSTRTTVLGSKPSVADISLYARLAPIIAKWTPEQRTGEQGYHHIVRHADFVQHAPLFGLKVADTDKVQIDPSQVISPIKPIDQKSEKERKKKEKELTAAGASAAAVAGGTVTSASSAESQAHAKSTTDKLADKARGVGDKIAAAVGAETPGVARPKKEKAPKQPKQPAAAVEKPLSPCMIDLRVGHILKAINHPNADALYVSTIACGDAPGTENTSEYEGHICRTVCSGLNGLVPLEEMQGRKIVAVCNLKPVTMRGIKSAAMVLAASPRLAPGQTDDHAGPVELVNIPAESAAGERVYFEGWQGEPEAVLNPKKKVWEMLQPGFTTTDGLEVGFKPDVVEQLKEKLDASQTGTVAKLRTQHGLCTVKTLKDATVR